MGTSNWPKPGTSTWPPADTFARPRTVCGLPVVSSLGQRTCGDLWASCHVRTAHVARTVLDVSDRDPNSSAQSWERFDSFPLAPVASCSRTHPPERLVAAIRVVSAGYGQFAGRSSVASSRSTCPDPEGGDAGVGALRNLSERELDVLRLIPAGSRTPNRRQALRQPKHGQTHATRILAKLALSRSGASGVLAYEQSRAGEHSQIAPPVSSPADHPRAHDLADGRGSP
jgi:hypothetical protein